MRAIGLLALLAMTGCSGTMVQEEHKLNAIITADFSSGDLSLACRESSSGTCHMLLTGKDGPVRISASAGASENASNIAPGTQFCIGDTPPADRCQLQALRGGEQIFRMQTRRTTSN
jgi:hypothetical protein